MRKFANTQRFTLIAGFGLVIALSVLTSLDPPIGIICSVMVLMIALIEPRPVLIVYGLTLALPLTGGLARGAVIPLLRGGQLLVVVGFILFVLAKPGCRGKFRMTFMDLAFALFMLAEAVFPMLALYYRGDNLSTSQNSYGLSPIQLLLGPLQYYLLYRIVVATITSEKQIRVVLNLGFIASIIVSIIGILQKLGVGPVKTFINTYYPPITLGYAVADVDQRITSTLQHFSGLGAYLTFTIIVALVCYCSRKQLKISSLLLAITILFDSIALVLTGTLAAWIGLAIGAVLVFVLFRSLPKVVIVVLIGIILAVIIFQPFISARLNEQLGAGAAQGLLPSSLAFRIQLWQDLFIPAIGQHLLFGSGPTPAVLENWSAEESQYILLLLRGGLFYFFSYILLIGVAIAASWQHIKRKNKEASRSVAIATVVILVVMSVMNISAEYFTYVGGTQTLWTLIAIVVASQQFNVSETPVSSRRIMNTKRQAEGNAFNDLSGIAAAKPTNLPVSRRHLAKERSLRASYSLISNSTRLSINTLYGHRRHSIRLDWHFVKDSLVVGASSMIARVLGLLFATILAHFLTPDDFGFFRYYLTLTIIITIASNSSPISIARFLAANSNDLHARNRYFSNGIVGAALLLTFSLFISVPILWLLHALDLGAVVCVACLAIYYCYLFVVRGLGSAWKMGLTYFLSNVALIIALFIVVGYFRLRTPTAALMIYGLTNLIPILVLEFVRPMELRFRRSLVSKAVLLDLARFAMPIVIASGAYTIWNGIDMLLVENFYPHAAGSFAAAKTLSQAFIFIPSAIAWVLLPRVAGLGSEKSKRYSAGAVVVALLISLGGLLIVYIWGHKLLLLTFGQRYSDAYLPLLVLSVGMSIYSLYIVLEGFIIGRGRPNLTAQAMIVAIIGTGATGFWLTSRLGPLGASLAFTIGAVLSFVTLIFNTRRYLHNSKQEDSDQLSRAGDEIAGTTI